MSESLPALAAVLRPAPESDALVILGRLLDSLPVPVVVTDCRNELRCVYGGFKLPERMSFEEGAAIPVNYATAWEAITRAGNVQRGERVLIHSAGGGVGIAATQLAKAAGAEVWGTASAAKHEAIRGFGVDPDRRRAHRQARPADRARPPLLRCDPGALRAAHGHKGEEARPWLGRPS